MKVKFVDFEEGITAFASKLIGTMPTTSHKFISGLVMARFAGRIENALAEFSDADGCVNTDEVRKYLDGGFRASGEKVSFTLGDDSTRLFFKPITVSLTREDVWSALSDIESRYGQ